LTFIISSWGSRVFGYCWNFCPKWKQPGNWVLGRMGTTFLAVIHTMERDEIFKVIAKLFKEKGFYNTSIKDISEKVGLKGGSLYYHIKSKEDALFRICEDAINRLLSDLERIVQTDDDPKTKLTKIVENHIKYFINNFYETSVFLIETKALGDNYQKMYTHKRDRFEFHIRNVLREGMRKGVFRKGDIKLMAFAILGMMNWMVIWYNPEGKWGANKIKKELLQIIFSGIEQ
jgi:AcrR family transcriptional regulator